MNDGVGQFAFWLAVGFLFLGATFGPIGAAVGRLLEAVVHRLLGQGGPRQAELLDQLARREAELQQVEQRLLEVEERLEFAERLLTSGRPGTGPEADTPPEPVEAAR